MAYSFNGSNQYITIGYNAAIDVTGSLTVFSTVKLVGAQTSYSGIICRDRNTLVASYVVTAGPNKEGTFLISSNGDYQVSNDVNTGSNVYDFTNWHSSAGKYVPSTRIEIFFDGVSKQAKTSSVPASLLSTVFNAFLARGYSGGAYTYLNGQLADSAIWSASLSDAEINSLHKGFKPTRIRPQSLVFYAPLIRNLQDIKAGLALTNNNTATVANHPRVY